MAALARALAARPGLALGLVALLALAGAVAGARLGVDPGNEALFLAKDPALPALHRFRQLFASDQAIIVALRGPIPTEAGLARVERLREALGGLAGVRSTLAITTVRNIYQGPVEAYGWAPYEWVKDGDRTADEFAREVLAEPLFAGNLISRDGRMAAIVCEVEGRDVAIVDAMRATARAAEGEGFEAFVAGTPVERVEFAETIRRDQAVFVPLIAVTLAALMAILFRQVWGVLVPLAMVGVSVAATVGIAALAGKQLNAVTSMLTPVVMVVSIAVSVNFLMAYVQARAEDMTARRVDAIAAALGRVGLPCLFTTATNVAGFGSLAASDVPAIADFGLLCALGCAISYAVALVALPPLLALEGSWGPGSLHLRPGKIEALLAAATPFFERRRRLVLGAAVAILALAATGIARIRVETDILGQLPSDGELLRATRAIDESLSGVNAIEVLVSGPPGALRTVAGVKGLAALQEWLERQDGVAKTFSPADILKRLHDVKKKAGRSLPDSQETLDYYFGLLAKAAGASKDGSNDPLKAFLTKDAAHARLTARLRALPSSRNMAILRGLAAEAARVLPPGVTAQPTGEFVLLQDMTAELPYAMLEGLVWATALIIGAMGLLFRSVRLAALAAIPASVPIVGVYGLMGWLGIWLSVPTAMISSVVLGLAVDSTILFLSRYRDERAEGRDRRAAVEGMLLHAGQSVTYSNLTLIFGFAVGVVSKFPPIRDFGLLTSLTIAASYLGALCLLPAMIFAARPGALTGRADASSIPGP